MTEKAKKKILNLVVDMGEYLAEYLRQDDFTLFDRDQVEDIETLDFILVEDTADADEVSKEYECVKNDIEIIACLEGSNVRNFLLRNGRFIIDKKIEKSPLSESILNHFFHKSLSLHIEESINGVEILDKFKITNHLFMGNLLDEVGLKASEGHYNLVPVRSFIDHTVYYFTYLKQAGLAGIPFEVELAELQDTLVLNIHCSVKNFVAEYLVDSFGQVNSKDPLKYLLGVITASANFTEISYIDKASKLALTGYFHKDRKSTFSGLSFNNIFMTEQIERQLDEKLSQFVPQVQKNQTEERAREELKNKELVGGLVRLITELPVNSLLNEKKDLTEDLISFFVNHFEDNYPNNNLAEFNSYHFEEFSPIFKDEEFIKGLSAGDKEHLIERVQKFHMAQAYQSEIEKVRSDLWGNEDFKQSYDDTIKDDIVDKLSSYVGLEQVNSILNSDESVESVIDEDFDPNKISTVFGDFTPSIVQNFDSGSAFEDLGGGFNSTQIDLSDALSELNPEDLKDKPFDLNSLNDVEFEPEANIIPAFEEEDFGDMFTPNMDSFPALDENQKISGGTEEDDFSQKVKGLSVTEDGMIKVGGSEDDPEQATLVKGGKEEADDFLQKISGMPKDEESPFMTTFSNSFADNAKNEKFVFKTSNAQERKKEMQLFVKSTLDETPGLAGLDMKIKAFVHKEAPERISRGLDHFATSLGKKLEDLTEEEVNKFKDEGLGEILTNLVQDDDSINEFKLELETYLNEEKTELPMPSADTVIPGSAISNFEKEFKNKLESKLAALEDLAKVDDKYVLQAGSADDMKVKNVVAETMREAFEEEFNSKTFSPQEREVKESQLIKDLSKTLHMEEEDVRQIVKGASNLAKEKEMSLIQDRLFNNKDLDKDSFNEDGFEEEKFLESGNSKTEAMLMTKLKAVEEENKHLKTSVSALQLKLESESGAKEKFEKIMNEAESDSVENVVIQGSTPEFNAVEVKKVIEDLQSGEPISEEVASKLAKSIEKESEIIELAKTAEANLRKFQIESEKKEALFKTELTKAEKILKGKDVVLEKAKESMKNFMGKKNKEVANLKSQVNLLNQKLKDDESTHLKTQVKALEREKESLTRTADVYKGKLESMAKNMAAKQNKDVGSQNNEVARNLERLKNQLEQKLNAETKLKKSFEDRYQKAKQGESKAKNEAVQAQTELKTTQSQLKLLKDQNTKLVQKAASSGNLSASKSAQEAETMKIKNNKLQDKIQNLNKKIAELENGAKPSMGANIGELAQNPDRAKIEIEKSFKEIDRLKDVNQKLQNKIEELNKANENTSVKSIDSDILSDAQASREAIGDKQTKKELEIAKSQNEQLQNKITELVEKLKKVDSKAGSASAADNGSAKEKRLEQSVKKMNAELTKTRNEAAERKKEAMKYKAEVTGLKNQISKLKKDLEKSKGPKKGATIGGKKKAA